MTPRAEERRIEDLRYSLEAQIAVVDALIASLEQQFSYVDSLFSAMRAAAEQN